MQPDKAFDKRQIAVRQCGDPTFWYTVLQSGRFYDEKSGKFNVPIEERYPNAIELFNTSIASSYVL